MISTGYNFDQFADSVKEKDFYDVIYLAEQEALATWRTCYKNRSAADAKTDLCDMYQTKLKGLIRFLRYGVASSGLSDHDIELCTSISRNMKLNQPH